ncbi:peptidylprolyl isomerase [uncultured Lamprocystis sp.]|jgi:peptidyl-prolyl cis-trans isomerase C|uniref:peptidylprolyl isomerase n=2 Tax=uncultured Lamprocystis sp. TaxID=543132 RepID=UPI0025F23BF7|nr:peptidylprolyl isomerase [uncultured Lamprocystis sp.]
MELQAMLKTRVSLLISALLASGLCLAEDKAPAADAAALPANVTIATVNGVAYPLDVFRMFFMERLQEAQGENDPAFQQQAFNEFMTMVVAAQEAQKRKLQDAPDVTAALEVQRLKVLSNAALADMARGIQVTDDELKKAYDEVKKNATRTEYKARHILVKEEAEAKKVIKELDKGADFGELAKKKSEGPTGKNGGDLDWFNADQMVKPFAEAVAKMKAGTYTKEPVQTQFGWHVINLQETRTAEPPKFEDAKPQLTALVQRQKLGQEMSKLRDGAMVDLNEQVVKVAPKTDEAAAPAKKDEEKKDKK